MLTSAEEANLTSNSVYLLPNVTNLTSSIDQRGASLAKSLSRLLDKIGARQCHLAAHSFTGVDARAAISMYGAAERVESLTTVCTPHLGMKLIDNCAGSPGEHAVYEQHLERTYEILGITKKAAHEFTSPNLKAFNEVCENAPGVDYYSIGARKDGKVMNEMLRNGYEIVVGRKFGDQCDGLVRDVEARWGRYLLTLNNDHFEVIGFTPDHNPANVFNLVADNVRVCEIKNDDSLKFDYGLDHL